MGAPSARHGGGGAHLGCGWRGRRPGQALRRSRAGSRREARLALLLLDTAFSSFHDVVPSGAGNGFT